MIYIYFVIICLLFISKIKCMNKLLPIIAFLSLITLASLRTFGQTPVTLSTSPYTENFDGIGNGLPNGFGIALSNAAQTFTPTTPTSWATTSGRFNNYASGSSGLASNATAVNQSAATNRALGIKQTGGFGDPGAQFLFAIANTQNRTSFKLSFELQSLDISATTTRTTTWVIQYKLPGDANFTTLPAGLVSSSRGNLQTGNVSFFVNNVTVDFGTLLDNINGTVTLAISTIANSTGSNSRASTGIDNFSLSWTDGPNTTPTLTLTSDGTTAIHSLSFPTIAMGTSAKANYILSGNNLNDNAVASVVAPYSLSLDDVNYSPQINVAPVNGNVQQNVYVRFSPVTAGTFTSNISNTATNALTKNVSLTGSSFDPATLHFDFNNVANGGPVGNGFTTYTSPGTVQWVGTTFGRNMTNGVNVNAGTNPVLTDAWLITPNLNISQINLPVLSFWSRGEFSGPTLQLLVSTDYTGSGNPNNATWNSLNANYPPNNNTWTLSDGINLSAYKNASNLYIAFRYSADPENGAARWTLDDIDISNRAQLLSFSPNILDFGEVAVGDNSASQAISVQSVGNGDVTLSATTPYFVSIDNVNFASSVVIPQNVAASGTTAYARLSPTSKQITLNSYLSFANGDMSLDSAKAISVTGSSYPHTETFDVAAYNLNFFGAGSSYSFTPQQIVTQMNNIKTVIRRLDIDVMGFEELSSEAVLKTLIDSLNNTSNTAKRYAYFLSDKYSYSFNPPDPTYPPQQIGFIYNSATMTPSTMEPPRVMFTSLYDSIRAGLATLANYPGGSSSSFWASGRLPYMATFKANVNGVSKDVHMVVLHAKSSSDAASYSRRVYDVQVLKDSLDFYYKNANVIMLGDYNDRVIGSIYTGHDSPYKIYVDDNTNYSDVTYALDQAGATSFIGGSGLIDHITINKGFFTDYLNNSAKIENPSAYIPNYGVKTASDHYPVAARFILQSPLVLPVQWSSFTATKMNNNVLLKWITASEINNAGFKVERSIGQNIWDSIGYVKAQSNHGNSSYEIDYHFVDENPKNGVNYYRLKQIDLDGKSTASLIRSVQFADGIISKTIKVYPNPAKNYILVENVAVGDCRILRN